MQIDSNNLAESGEARRHLETLWRRRWYVVVPFVLALAFAVSLSRGGEEVFVARADVRVPSGQASIFGEGGGSQLSSSEAERIIASAIQLIRGNNVRDAVQAEISQEIYDQVEFVEVSSISDTFFVRITVGSLDPAVARTAARSYADQYIDAQSELDVADLATREEQLRSSALLSQAEVDSIDEALRSLDEQIVRIDFEIRALEAQLEQGVVPEELVDKTIERNDLDRQRTIELSNRSRESQEASFLRQEASNLQIEQSYRIQTGAQLVAEPSDASLRPGRSLSRDLILFGLLGGMAGAAAALAREYFDSKVRTPSDLHDLAPGVPIIGAIPRMKNVVGQPHLATATGRPWYAAEAFRALRTAVLATQGATHRCLVTSSVGANAGKSVTVTNLATSLAQAGYKTLVIDANLRRPSLHMKLRVRNDRGLSDHLLTAAEPASLAVRTELHPRLSVIPAGHIPENPAELLGSKAMHRLLDWAQEEYDYVVVDTPPLDVFTDGAVLGRALGGVLLVVRFEATDLGLLAETLDRMDTASVNIWGIVVNGRRHKDSRAARYARRVGARNLKTLWTDRPGRSRAVGEAATPPGPVEIEAPRRVDEPDRRPTRPRNAGRRSAGNTSGAPAPAPAPTTPQHGPAPAHEGELVSGMSLLEQEFSGRGRR